MRLLDKTCNKTQYRKAMQPDKNVVGDSIESCIYSRYLVSKDENCIINHVNTGEYGGFYSDEVKDSSYCPLFLTGIQLSKILQFIPDLEVVSNIDSYVKIPHKTVKGSTKYDNYLKYPINKTSFESDEEYNKNVLKTYTKDEFMSAYKASKNVTGILRSMFSDEIYSNIIKKVGCNQWKTRQSYIEPSRLYDIVCMDQISSSVEFQYHYIIDGVSAVCKKLLDHPRIKPIELDRKNIRQFIKSQTTKVTYLFEYIDYYMDFMFGGFDYVMCKTDIHNVDEIECKYFKILTPSDTTYYSYCRICNVTYKIANELMAINKHEFTRGLLTPTSANYKKLHEYRKLAVVNPTIEIMIP